ncbi:hypothetical protein [Streptomyces sp. NPDC046805]|uniref:hypothetical protein n=1 Tax=Streptomyces sp. NPDC046805 TaxID=3155134 RepID=UPI0033CAAA30
MRAATVGVEVVAVVFGAADGVEVAVGAVVLGSGDAVFTLAVRFGAEVFFGALVWEAGRCFGRVVVFFGVLDGAAVGVFDAAGVGLSVRWPFQRSSQSRYQLASFRQSLAALASVPENGFIPPFRHSAQATATDGTPTAPIAMAAMTIRR